MTHPLALFSTLSLLASLSALPALAADAAPDITGHWVSSAAEPQGPIFATRDFTFDNRDWSVTFRGFADAEMQKPLFRIDVSGVYVIGGAASAVPGAFEGIFPATKRDITAESAEGVAMFGQMGCTLEQGVTKHLVNEGCGFLPALTAAMGEYDLVSLNDGQLFFGDRSGDLTKARPTMLTPFALVKK